MNWGKGEPEGLSTNCPPILPFSNFPASDDWYAMLAGGIPERYEHPLDVLSTLVLREAKYLSLAFCNNSVQCLPLLVIFMKHLVSAVLALSLFASASPAFAAAVVPLSWDRSYTVTLAKSVPTEHVVHTMKERTAKIYVGTKDFLRMFERRYIPYDPKKELLAAVEQRSHYMDEVDTSLVVVVPISDDYIMALIRPLIRRRGKVAILDSATGQLVPTITIRDHGQKIGDKAYSGSIDYVLPSGEIFYSEKHY